MFRISRIRFINILTFVLLLASSFVTLEFCLKLYAYSKFKFFSSRPLIAERIDCLSKLVSPAFMEDPKREWENKLILHPLFGYVYNQHLKGINNFGFRTRRDILLNKNGYFIDKNDHGEAITLGIFGGSFAEQIGDAEGYFEHELKSLFPGKIIRVMNFAIGGYALPQTFYTFTYFKELFDVVIFIDGLNEIWNPIDNNEAGYPLEFAKAHHFKYKLSLNAMSPVVFEATENLISLKKNLSILLCSLFCLS